ncbi:hypothetical protein VP01_1035g3 [Puccinia sorghi]|uniref:Uncharacterized protein n=1 Tax=Puccinia sorghi TaxID=27349 RepID=A0A0L6VUI1_9BASI|nr:hypothetical protein VP01_1035g3 [Puccinia sorghi]
MHLETAQSLEIIHADEATHVAAGKSFILFCLTRQATAYICNNSVPKTAPVSLLRKEVKIHFFGKLKPPFNVEGPMTVLGFPGMFMPRALTYETTFQNGLRLVWTLASINICRFCFHLIILHAAAEDFSPAKGCRGGFLPGDLLPGRNPPWQAFTAELPGKTLPVGFIGVR